MSETGPSAPAPPPPRPRGGCMTAFMFVVGAVLLLPGLCSLWATALTVPIMFKGDFDAANATDIGLWLLGFAIAAGGILLIRAAFRGPRR
jgi:hypothetical protein